VTTIHVHARTTLTPEQFIAGLTDFGPGRSELFGRSDDDHLDVLVKGERHAFVTEGSGGIWERLYYDWSDPRHVVATTTDSNVWSRHSSHRYNLRLRSDGTTDVGYVVVRRGKNLRGWYLAAVLDIIGEGVLQNELQASVKAIETRRPVLSQAS
jgi:hypothetical protein